MIVVDSSALCAILFDEPEARAFFDLMARNKAVVSAPTLVEASIVLTGRDVARPHQRLSSLLEQTETQSIAFEPAMAELAAAAFEQFGKGRRHPARLNFGDCMAYAVAKLLDAPLLYKGDDFAQTDIRSALS